MKNSRNDLTPSGAGSPPPERDLYSIFMQAPAMVCVFGGPDHVFQFVNPPYQALVGDRPLLGRPIAEAMPELAGQPIFGLLDQVYRTGEPFHAHEMPVRLDHANTGGAVGDNYYNFTYQATRGESGEVIGILVFAYEVTEQVRAKQKVEELNAELDARVKRRTRQLEAAMAETQRQSRELEMQQGLLSQILGQVPAFIATLQGPEHRFTFFNDHYLRLSGNRARLGLTAAEVLPEVVGQGFIRLLDGVYRTGEPFVGEGMPILLLDEATGGQGQRYVDFVYQPLKDRRGKTEGILAFILDVTDRFTAKRELEQANTRLMATNADLDNFIYTASHDLRTPILNIEGLLGVLLEELPPAVLGSFELQRTVGLMQNSIGRFKATIGYLTEITKLQNEGGGDATLTSLGEIISDIILDLAAPIREAGAEIIVDTEGCPPVNFSPKNLRSIVFNLLSNSIKYRSPERAPAVEVRCRREGGHLVLSVRDNGLGMDLGPGNRLFRMFSRLHDHVEGTGIGLYMARKIIGNAGGRIEVESKVGEGSTFTVHLPLGDNPG